MLLKQLCNPKWPMALCTLYDNFVSGELCEARQESILHVLRFPRRLIFHFIWFLLSRLVFGFLVIQGLMYFGGSLVF